MFNSFLCLTCMWIKNYKSLFQDEHLKLWLKLSSLIISKNLQENVLYLRRRKIEWNFIGQQWFFLLFYSFLLISVYRFARGQQSCISRLISDTEFSRWLLCFLDWYNYEYYFSWHKHNNSNWQNPNVLYGNHYRPSAKYELGFMRYETGTTNYYYHIYLPYLKILRMIKYKESF